MRIRIPSIVYHIIPWATIISANIVAIVNQKEPSLLHNFSSLFFSSVIFISIFYLNYYVIVPKTLIAHRKRLLFILACSLLLAISIALQIAIHYITSLIAPIKHSHEKEQQLIIGLLMNPLGLIFFSTFIRLSREFAINRKNQKELEKQVLSAELLFLKSQINPHFLFNTLNNIYALTITKSDSAPEAVLKLSNMMRYMLHDSASERVMLAEEVDYLKSFISLQELRIVNPRRVQVSIQLPSEDFLIAPLLLIPTIENAFKHADFSGVDNRVITINIRVNNCKLVLEVENRFKPFEKDTTSGVGLKNLKRRLDLIYPEKYTLVINEHTNTYYTKLEVILE